MEKLFFKADIRIADDFLLHGTFPGKSIPKLIIDITLAAIVKRNGNLLLYVKQFEPIIIANIGQIVFIAIKPPVLKGKLIL